MTRAGKILTMLTIEMPIIFKLKIIVNNIYSDNSLDSLSSLIMLSHLKVEMVYQCQ